MHNLSYRSLFSRDMQVELDNFAWQILWTRVNQRSPTAPLTNKHININICLNHYNLIKWFHKKNILFLTFRPVSFLRGIAGPPSPPIPPNILMMNEGSAISMKNHYKSTEGISHTINLFCDSKSDYNTSKWRESKWTAPWKTFKSALLLGRAKLCNT